MGKVGSLVFVFLLACGGGRSTIDLPAPVAHTSAAALDFGLSDCGGTGAPLTLTVTNDATALPLSWAATVEGPFALTGPTQGSLTSHESATLEVVPEVPTTADAAMPVAGTLKLVTNDPRNPELRIPLGAVARGASLSFPASVDFGDIPVTASSPAVPVAFKNLGNAAVDVDVGVPSNPDFVRIAGALHLEPGQEASASYRFSPSQWMVETSSAAVTAKGPVCGAPLEPLALIGRGTKGVVLTSPGKLDFGLVDCGTQAAAKTVVVQNTGNASFDVTAALATGTSFTVSPTVGKLQPGGALTLTVTPSGVPAVSAVTPDLYADTLTITTSALGDFPHVVDLHETARGAILVASGTPSFGNQLVDEVSSVSWGLLENHGNVGALVSGSSPNVPAFVVPQGVPAGGATTVVFGVKPDPAVAPLGVTSSDAVTLAVSGATCGPVPVLPFELRSVDTAKSVAMAEDHGYAGSLCVVGHTGRGYCMGAAIRGEWLGINSNSGISYDFLLQPGIVAERVSAANAQVCWALGAQVTCVGPGGTYVNTDFFPAVTTTTFASPIVEMSGDGAVYGDCSVLLRLASGAVFGLGDDFGNFGAGSLHQTGLFPAMGNMTDGAAAALGHYMGCAARTDGSVVCSGDSFAGKLGPLAPCCQVANPVAVPGVSARQLAGATDGAVAAQLDGTVVYWPGPYDSSVAAVPGISDAVEVSASFTRQEGCARRAGGGVRCWGWAIPNQDIALAGPATQLASGTVEVGNGARIIHCAIEGNGKLSCWDRDPQQAVAHRMHGFD